MPQVPFPQRALPTKHVDSLVVGGGLSGFTTAYYLQKKGVNVMLAEARDELGGNIVSKEADGFLWEEGPNSFQPHPSILRFAKDLNILDELVWANPSLPRFIFWGDRLHALPTSAGGLLRTELLTWRGKLRFIFGALGFIRRPSAEEESVRAWTTRHFGQEVFERIIDPFISGVYAGDPNQLSMSAALKKIKRLEELGCTRGILDGLLVRLLQLKAQRKAAPVSVVQDLPEVPSGSLGTFRSGMQTLPRAVHRALGDAVHLQHTLVSLQRRELQEHPEGGAAACWEAVFHTPEGVQTVVADCVVLATPAHALPSLLNDTASLCAVHYPLVAAVVLAYPQEAFKEQLVGFGHLLPRAMGIRTLGCIWVSSLFPSRAPQGYQLINSFIGGAQDESVGQLSDEELVQQVHADISRVLLTSSAVMPKVLGVRRWPRAIPQYNLGHAAATAVRTPEGVFLAGNYATGVSLGDCVLRGGQVADEVQAYLQQHKQQ